MEKARGKLSPILFHFIISDRTRFFSEKKVFISRSAFPGRIIHLIPSSSTRLRGKVSPRGDATSYENVKLIEHSSLLFMLQPSIAFLNHFVGFLLLQQTFPGLFYYADINAQRFSYIPHIEISRNLQFLQKMKDFRITDITHRRSVVT